MNRRKEKLRGFGGTLFDPDNGIVLRPRGEGATNFEHMTTAQISGDMRDSIATVRDDDVEAHPGFRFCVNSTCGVEIRHGHPTRACRSHRADGRTRPPYRGLLTVSPGWTRVTALGWNPM